MSIFDGIDDIRSEKIRWLDRWWLDKGNGRVPSRSDFDPVDFQRILPNLMIVELVKPFRIRYRLVGTMVVEATGMDFTGRYLEELIPAEHEPWLDHYRRAHDLRRPVLGEAEAATIVGTPYYHEFGIFPLRVHGDAIEQFLAIEDYAQMADGFPDLVQWRIARHAARVV